MPHKQGSIELYMGPHDVGGPDDLEKAVVDFIDGAENKLDIAVQELESEEIAAAILRARDRRLTVRVVVESDYLTVNRPMPDPYSPGGTNEANRRIFNALLRSRAKVRSDFNGAIFHQKFVIRDGAEVLTGSTNFTPTGVHNNLNHVVIIRNKEVALEYTREFTEINRGQFGRYSVEHSKAPEENTVSNVNVKVLFAPDHNPEMEIMKQIAKARERIDFAIFTFSQSSGIDDALIQARNAGVRVRGVLDAGQGNQDWAATRPVKNAGAELYLVAKQGGVGKLHHKLMVIDGQVMIAGSFNYTDPANQLNDENIVVLGQAEPPNATARNAQQKLAGYALTEIDRIIAKHAYRLPQ